MVESQDFLDTPLIEHVRDKLPKRQDCTNSGSRCQTTSGTKLLQLKITTQHLSQINCVRHSFELKIRLK